MAKKKKQLKQFPEDFSDFKIIKKFRKHRSPRTRIFATNDPEEWFIDVLEIKTKTGEVTDEEGWILEKDVETWVDWYKRLGWIEQ